MTMIMIMMQQIMKKKQEEKPLHGQHPKRTDDSVVGQVHSHKWLRTAGFKIKQKDESLITNNVFFFLPRENSSSNQKPQRCLSFAPKFPSLGARSALTFHVASRSFPPYFVLRYSLILIFASETNYVSLVRSGLTYSISDTSTTCACALSMNFIQGIRLYRMFSCVYLNFLLSHLPDHFHSTASISNDS